MNEKCRIEFVPVGPLEVNCYLVGCAETGDAVVIDPGADPALIIERIEAHGFRPRMIINTHGHLDHTAANAAVAEQYGIQAWMHRDDLFMLDAPDIFGLEPLLEARPRPQPARFIAEGEHFRLGRVEFRVMHTPGHTPGSICLQVESYCLTGDTVFAGSVGRTDLPGGDSRKLMHSINTKIKTLPAEMVLLPGHGPATTAGEESSNNPFFR